MDPKKWIWLGVGLLLTFALISVIYVFVNGSKGNVSRGQTQLTALNKQTQDDDIKPYANQVISGQSLSDLKITLKEANRKVNLYYVNIGGSGVVPLFINPNGAMPYQAPTGVTAPTLPTNLQSVAGGAPTQPSTAQVTATVTTSSRDYIDPNATYKTVVYTDTAKNVITTILAVQQQ